MCACLYYIYRQLRSEICCITVLEFPKIRGPNVDRVGFLLQVWAVFQRRDPFPGLECSGDLVNPLSIPIEPGPPFVVPFAGSVLYIQNQNPCKTQKELQKAFEACTKPDNALDCWPTCSPPSIQGGRTAATATCALCHLQPCEPHMNNLISRRKNVLISC